MAWYTDKVKDNIDVTQAVRDAGKLGEAIAYAAQGVKGYADTIHAKKREKVVDSQKAAANATKRYVANKGYAGKVDSARIRASASDRRNAASIKVAGINFNREKYKSDSAYKKAIDQEVLRNKGKKITAGAKVKAASISAGAKRYSADVTRENNKRTTSTALETTKLRTKTQLDVAAKNAENAKAKAAAKQTKAKAAKLDLSADAPDEEILMKLHSKKKNGDIGSTTIEF